MICMYMYVHTHSKLTAHHEALPAFRQLERGEFWPRFTAAVSTRLSGEESLTKSTSRRTDRAIITSIDSSLYTPTGMSRKRTSSDVEWHTALEGIRTSTSPLKPRACRHQPSSKLEAGPKQHRDPGPNPECPGSVTTSNGRLPSRDPDSSADELPLSSSSQQTCELCSRAPAADSPRSPCAVAPHHGPVVAHPPSELCLSSRGAAVLDYASPCLGPWWQPARAQPSTTPLRLLFCALWRPPLRGSRPRWRDRC